MSAEARRRVNRGSTRWSQTVRTLRDRDVELDEGELYVVPRGVEHCPRAEEEASVLLIEPSGTINTGNAGGPLTTEPERI